MSLFGHDNFEVKMTSQTSCAVNCDLYWNWQKDNLLWFVWLKRPAANGANSFLKSLKSAWNDLRW